MSSQVTVLLATNDTELLNDLGFALNHQRLSRRHGQSGDGAIALADSQLPQIAVVDMLLPGPQRVPTRHAS